MVSARPDAGFTMVEIIAVLLIIGIVLGIGTLSLKGSHARSSSAQARTVAQQLGEAIQQFQRDHGGRPPGQPGTVDWGNKFLSPIDRGNGNHAYASAASLDSLNSGAVALETTAGRAAPGATPTARIRYFENPSTNLYALVVYVDRDGTRRPVCWVSNGAAASVRQLTGNVAGQSC
jgi:prepilin-type N-terminal cleavage/methylation domain-containing protein